MKFISAIVLLLPLAPAGALGAPMVIIYTRFEVINGKLTSSFEWVSLARTWSQVWIHTLPGLHGAKLTTRSILRYEQISIKA